MKEKQFIGKKAAIWMLIAALLLSVAVPTSFAQAEEQKPQAAEAAQEPDQKQQQEEQKAEVKAQAKTETPAEKQETVTVKRPTYVKSEIINHEQIKVSWKKVTGADGYDVYRYSSKQNRYLRYAANVKGTSYTDKKVVTGKTYYYKIKAYKMVDGKRVISMPSRKAYRKARPSAPTIKTQAGRKQATIKWNKIAGADGYSVYRASSKNGQYKRVATVKSAKTLVHVNKGLTSGKTYHYKVRAYKHAGGEKVLSYASEIKSATAKKPDLPYYNKEHKFYYKKRITVKAYAYSGGGRTAMGTRARVGAIAVDPRVISLGTKVYVDGYGYARAEDTGGNIKGKTVDLYMNSSSACYRWGVRYKSIYLGVVEA